MLKKCLHGFFQDATEIHEPLTEIHIPLEPVRVREIFIIDASPPLSSYLTGEFAPLPLRRNDMKAKGKVKKQRKNAYRTSSIPPKSPDSIQLQPCCEDLKFHEHTYINGYSEQYCSICDRNEVAYQCKSCTMSACWGCYGTHVRRYI